MSDCLFCKIVSGEIPSEFIYEDEMVVAFRDIDPQAPHHLLIIPREHISGINEADETKQLLLGRLFVAARRIAEKLGVADDGYRCIVNTNRDAGQEVFHFHLHLMAGRPLGRMLPDA